MFAPFAGTEGYNPIAYIPYIVAAEIGHLLKLDFAGMLLLMRFFGPQLSRRYCDRIGEMSGRHCLLKRRRRLPSSVMDLVSQQFPLNFPAKRRL
jgi:hypothetical protein